MHDVTSVACEVGEFRGEGVDFDRYKLTIVGAAGTVTMCLFTEAGADIGLDALLPIPGCDGEDMMPTEEAAE